MEVAGVNITNTDRYVFVYDADGNPHELHYYASGATTPTKYYYVLNLQGDVIQLRDSNSAVVANYTYDAWGKLLSVTNANGEAITSSTNIANVNPIRYRGYFYDSETKLYYCNSRYYDPQIKRFINADELLSTGTGFNGFNMFAYCNNNPVMYCDPSGCVVTSWDRAYLSDIDIDYIEYATAQWEYWNDQKYKGYTKMYHDQCRLIREETMRKLGITNLEVASNGYVRLTSGDYSGRYVGTYVYKKEKINYYFSDTVITLPVNQDGMYSILYYSLSSAIELTEQMLCDYYGVWGVQFPGRSATGLFAEIDAHYTCYFFTRNNRFKFADLEGENFPGTQNYKIFEIIYGR